MFGRFQLPLSKSALSAVNIRDLTDFVLLAAIIMAVRLLLSKTNILFRLSAENLVLYSSGGEDLLPRLFAVRKVEI